jgi:hypothetical protein
MERIALLQPVARRPFSRILITIAFNSSSVGDSDGIHLKLCVYQETVAGETL